MTNAPPKKAATSGWTQIPEELLILIMQQLTLPDMIRIGCVCSYWRSVSAPARHGKLPWLMLPYDTREAKDGAYGFFSLYDQQFYKLQLTEAAGARIHGSSHGWLITVHPVSGINLLHPFSRVRIQLPGLSTFPDVRVTFYSNEGGIIYVLSSSKGCRTEYGFKWMRDSYIGKFALSSSPSSSSDCIVVAIYGERRKLAFCRPFDNRWTPLKTPWDSYEDIVFHKGRLCALDLRRRLVVCHVGYSSRVYEIMPPSTITCGSQWEYLMSWAGELMMILRDVKWISDADGPGRESSCGLSGNEALDIADGDANNNEGNESDDQCNKDSSDDDIFLCKTVGFKVYTLDFDSRRWIRVKSLGNTMVFLCESNLLSLPDCHFDRNRGDRIYFIDDSCDTYTREHREGVYELSAFKMVDQTIESFFRTDNKMNMPTPIWVAP